MLVGVSPLRDIARLQWRPSLQLLADSWENEIEVQFEKEAPMASVKLVQAVNPEISNEEYIDKMPQAEIPLRAIHPGGEQSSILLTFKEFPVGVAHGTDCGKWFQVDMRLPLKAEVEYQREKAIFRIRFPKGDGPVPRAES